MTHPTDEELDALDPIGAWRLIAALRAQLAEASTRIAAMESGDWSEVKLVRFENGQMDISAGPIPVIAEYLAQMMQDGEGKYFNYIEMTFDHKIAGPMTLSLQRKNGKTPNQLRKEAEARADRAEAERAAQIEVDAEIANDFHRRAIEWAKTVRGLEKHIGETDSSRIATAIRAQPHDRTALDRMLVDAREKALREAAELCSSIRQRIANGPMPEGARFDYEQSILAMIEKDREN